MVLCPTRSSLVDAFSAWLPVREAGVSGVDHSRCGRYRSRAAVRQYVIFGGVFGPDLGLPPRASCWPFTRKRTRSCLGTMLPNRSPAGKICFPWRTSVDMSEPPSFLASGVQDRGGSRHGGAQFSVLLVASVWAVTFSILRQVLSQL